MFQGEMKAGDHILTFGGVTHVMGVINVSPESKNRHTIATTPQEALLLARRYQEWGADLVDVGGQSSHYENPTISARRELERVIPVVETLAGSGFVVSVDTWKVEVARAAIEAGAAIINDTGGLRDPDMRRAVTGGTAAAVAVYVDGRNPHDVDEVNISPRPAERVAKEFRELLAGFDQDLLSRLVIDPGIAINYRGDYAAYTRMQLEVIRQSHVFVGLGRPLLIPIPRKADINWVSAYIAMALEYGADIIRVHDVSVAADLTRLWGREVPR